MGAAPNFCFFSALALLSSKTRAKNHIPILKITNSLHRILAKTFFCRTFAPSKNVKEIEMTADKVKTFDVLVEIPRGSRNKYEYDFELKRMRFDRMLFSSMMYPADYGFIPETLALDGDPLDVLVLVTKPTFPGCVIEVKPIGVFHMADDKGPDEKIICVPVSDPIWNSLNDLSDINDHLLKEIEHFFQVYKDLENKKVDVEGWGDVKEAQRIISECVKRFEDIENKPEGLFSIK
jgi:inorganic pyrophosphatase